MAPAPADLDMLATLRLDACSSPDLMREQYRVRPCHWWIWNAQRSCAVPEPGKRTPPGHCCLFMLTEPLLKLSCSSERLCVPLHKALAGAL